MAKTKHKGLTVREGHGRSPKYVLSFTYKGVYCRETLAIPISSINEKYAARLLGEIQLKIDRGDFRYADYFPDSPKCRIFGVTASNSRVLDYLNIYISNCERRGLAPSTIKGYLGDKECLKDLHQIKVSELTPAMIRNWVTNQKLSKNSIKNRIALLRASLNDAVTDGLLVANPVKQLNIFSYISSESTTDVDPFDPEEVAQILKAAFGRSELEYAFFLFAFETGMRTGELIALQWCDIDWLKEEVVVSRSLVVGIEKGPKTNAGKRAIKLSAKAKEALKILKPLTMLLGDKVFVRPKTMEPWTSKREIQHSWTAILKIAKIRYRKPYNTRHTFATKHISQNANIFWLAKQMGHRTPSMLFRHYGSYLEKYAKALEDDSKNTSFCTTVAPKSVVEA